MSDYLCEELMLEIFSRLPPKSFLRFRSLSKSWYTCISSPDFICMHTFRSPPKLLIRHRIYHKEADQYEGVCTLHSQDQLPLCPRSGYFGITPLRFTYSRSNIIGSCNGIFCLFDKQTGFSLWNPLIRRILTLPNCPQKCSRVARGFGFDPITDDYKIVNIPNPGYERIVKSSFVYAVKKGSWFAIAPPSPPSFNVLSKACFVDGALHWAVQTYYAKSDDIDRFYILTFDLSTHIFGMIMVPKPTWITSQLTIIQGSLAMSCTKHGDSWIWVRRDASWSVFFKSTTNEVQGGLYRVLQVTLNSDILFDTYYQGFQVYNFKTDEQSRLVDFNNAFPRVTSFLMSESLQLLDKGTTCDRSQPYFS